MSHDDAQDLMGFLVGLGDLVFFPLNSRGGHDVKTKVKMAQCVKVPAAKPLT